MSNQSAEIIKKKKTIVRGVLLAEGSRADDPNVQQNKTENEVKTNEIICTIRPRWSEQGPRELALPGGKVESEEIPAEFNIEDINNLNTGLQALLLKELLRELEEELGADIIKISAQLAFYFIGVFENQGWFSIAFAAELPKKPTLEVKPGSAGTVWISKENIEGEGVDLFADHLKIAREALDRLNAETELI